MKKLDLTTRSGLDKWIESNGITVIRDSEWDGGDYRWIIECPFNEGHTDGAAFIARFTNGAISAGCHHDGCKGKKWHDLRDLKEPEWRNQRTKKSTSKSDARYTSDVLATMLTERFHFAQDTGQRLYRYVDGVYRDDGEAFVQLELRKLLEEMDSTKQWSRHLQREVAEYIRVGSPVLDEHPKPNILNLRNGLLDVVNRTLLDHTLDHLSSVQYPVRYDPDATCEELDKWIAQTLDKEEIEVLYEILAWVLMADNPKDQAVMLLGKGGNGKSIFLAVILAFLGQKNTSNISLQKLNTNRFAASRLVGKAANICSDLPGKHLSETDMFKRITGGDPVNTEYKHGKDFDFTPWCKLLFSANKTPTTSDTSYAFYRRWVILPFEKTFEGDNREKRQTLLARITVPDQLSGLLNKALTKWNSVSEHGLSCTDKMYAAFLEFKGQSNPETAWLGDFVRKDPNGLIECSFLYDAYCKHAKTHGIRVPSKKWFGNSVREFSPAVNVVHRGSDTKPGKRTKHYSGLAWMEDSDTATDTTDNSYYRMKKVN